MKVGDLVKRRISSGYREQDKKQYDKLGDGLILSKQLGGSGPVHPCLTVLYPKTGQIYDIAESLMEVC